MCGPFARYSLSREIERYFNAQPPPFEIQPSYNVAPTQEIPVIVQHEDARHIKKRHWGWGEPFAFAGLYEVWEDKEAPPQAWPYMSCTLITMDARDSVKDIHDRMPLILKPEACKEWLDPDNKEPAKIEELLRTRYVKDLKSYPVSKLVNQIGNNNKECMEPLNK